MNKFKVGDKVYCPIYSQKVYTVLSSFNEPDPSYPIMVNFATPFDPRTLEPITELPT